MLPRARKGEFLNKSICHVGSHNWRTTMRVMYQRVAGLDVHKKTVVACRMQVTSAQRIVWETRTFGTLTRDLLQLHDWVSGLWSR